MNIEQVVSRFGNARKTSDGWMVSCPMNENHMHGDRNPSLSITNSGDRILMHCFAGCETAKIVERVGLKMSDLFLAPTIVIAYDYTDEKGNLLYQNVRFSNKTFKRRRPRKDFLNEWTWKMDGVRRVLYRLPEVIKAKRIYLVEGEKSADALCSLGVCATSYRGNLPSILEPLKGKQVIVIPDNDKPGMKHAHRAAKCLERCKVLTWDKSKPTGYDPANFVEDGGTLETLEISVDNTPEYIPGAYWTGSGIPLVENYIEGLNSLGFEFRLNTSNDIVDVNETQISDIVQHDMRAKMRDLCYTNMVAMEDAYHSHAATKPYHPVKEYLEALKWDGEDHINDLSNYIKDKNNFLPVFLRRWMIGAVARVYESTQNRMLILDGPQGIGKSYLVKWLASGTKRPELFAENAIRPDNKDDMVRVITTWIWEVGELGSTTLRSDREALKFFLSLTQVTVRRPYGKYDLVKPALTSFMGTTNNVAGILNDVTGYRRFMSVELTNVDWSYTKEIDINQLWAQAKALYDKGETWNLLPDEIEMAVESCRELEVVDPLYHILNNVLEKTGQGHETVSSEELRQACNNNNWRLRTPRSESMAIAAAMLRVFNVKSDRYKNEKGEKVRGFVGFKVKPSFADPVLQ